MPVGEASKVEVQRETDNPISRYSYLKASIGCNLEALKAG